VVPLLGILGPAWPVRHWCMIIRCGLDFYQHASRSHWRPALTDGAFFFATELEQPRARLRMCTSRIFAPASALGLFLVRGPGAR